MDDGGEKGVVVGSRAPPKGVPGEVTTGAPVVRRPVVAAVTPPEKVVGLPLGGVTPPPGVVRTGARVPERGLAVLPRESGAVAVEETPVRKVETQTSRDS